MFRSYSIEPVDSYIGRLNVLLSSLSPGPGEPTMAVLTPGVHNSAYFEHAFLAQQLGIELVEGSDLVVLEDDTVYMRTVGGLERVDVIYRRIDELFLDPEVFRRDWYVGCRGSCAAWRKGNVAIVSAPGAGIADDKAVYAFVPEIIRFFLGEEPVLPNVPTWRCGDPEDCQFVLGHLDALVVKPANESGGYGVVIGPTAGADALAVVARRIEQYPPNWVAQPCCRSRLCRPCVTVRSCPVTWTCGPLPCSDRKGRTHLGWAHPGGAQCRLAHRELLAGRWQQGHLGRRRHAVGHRRGRCGAGLRHPSATPRPRSRPRPSGPNQGIEPTHGSWPNRTRPEGRPLDLERRSK